MIEHSYQQLFEQFSPRADRNKVESPLEELFISNLEKYITATSTIYPQKEIQTVSGVFRLDFLIIYDDKKIAFECDGKDYHDEWRDEWRDALILGSGEVDTIYRFKGRDIHTFLHDCIHLIYHYDKTLFSERFPIISERLISQELKEYLNSSTRLGDRVYLHYKAKTEDGEHIGWLNLVMDRRNKKDKSGFWNKLYSFAKDNIGLGIDQLIVLYEKQSKEAFK